MENFNLILFLFTGLGFGVLHAFDPDHLAAAGALGADSASSNSESRHRYRQYALRWSFGHGCALLCLATFVFFLGFPVPENVSRIAEKSVAFLLIILGLSSLFGVFSLTFRGLFVSKVARANKVSVEEKGKSIPNSWTQWLLEKRAGVIGLVHGTAGSASLFALVPIAKVGSVSFALGYVLSFSAGVVLAMFILGSSLNFMLSRLNDLYSSIHRMTAILLSLVAIFLGFLLLFT